MKSGGRGAADTSRSRGERLRASKKHLSLNVEPDRAGLRGLRHDARAGSAAADGPGRAQHGAAEGRLLHSHRRERGGLGTRPEGPRWRSGSLIDSRREHGWVWKERALENACLSPKSSLRP